MNPSQDTEAQPILQPPDTIVPDAVSSPPTTFIPPTPAVSTAPTMADAATPVAPRPLPTTTEPRVINDIVAPRSTEQMHVEPSTPSMATAIQGTPPPQIQPPTVAAAADQPLSPPKQDTTVTNIAPEPQPSTVTVTSSEPTAIVSANPAVTPPKQQTNKKRLWFAIGGGILLALLSGGFAFGYYLPSRPAAVWGNGFSRTGTALAAVVSTATNSSTLSRYTTTSLKGSVILKANDTDYNGTFTAKLGKENTDGGLTMTVTSGQTTLNLSGQLLSKLSKDALYPDSYIKISGIKNLGLDALLPGISNYDSQWIKVSADYLKERAAKTVGDTSQITKKQDDITTQEVAALSKKITDITTTYVFTGDTQKAVLSKKTFVGKEKFDSMHAYHYTATLNQKNLEAYCVALGNAVLPSNVYKKLTSSSDAAITAAQKKLSTDCSEGSTNAVKQAGVVGVWIDTDHTLIYKIRVASKDTPDSYVEVGQNYKGANNLSLFTKVYDDTEKTMLNATADVDLDSQKIESGLSYMSSSASSPIHLSATLEATPLKSEPSVSAPSTSTKIEDVLLKLGISL